MDYKTIIYEQRGQAAWIYLNRPEIMNSINTTLILEMDDALKRAEIDDEVRVLVLSGKGDKAFCAGGDLKAFLEGLEGKVSPGPSFLDLTVKTIDHLRYFPKPVIAAVNGLALAGGLELIMCCDIVIAVESVRIGDAHSNYGLVPGAGGAAILPRKVGLNRAKYLLFTGDFISAKEMKDFGLVNEVVPDGELESSVQELIDKLVAKSPLVLRRMKEVANESFDQSQAAALRHEQVMLTQHRRSEDIREGLTAFKEKRKPNFRGK